MIVTLRRVESLVYGTFGELSVGTRAWSSLEPPMALFRQSGPAAFPAGQYPLGAVAGRVVVNPDGPARAVFGVDIYVGRGTHADRLTQVEPALVEFLELVVPAIERGQDVLIDVIDAEAP